jgi:hypothetical protein
VIRVNLLPQKRRAEAKAETKQLWLVAVMVAFLAEVAALFVFHGFKNEELNEQRQKNSQLESQIEQSKKSVTNHPEVKKRLEELRAREAAIGRLQARTGRPPSCSSSHILTPGSRPAQPAATRGRSPCSTRTGIASARDRRSGVRPQGQARGSAQTVRT